jgi:hypothetical protein
MMSTACSVLMLREHMSHMMLTCKMSHAVTAVLVQAWDVRNNCKLNGAVLPLSAAPVGRGADGVDAMA